MRKKLICLILCFFLIIITFLSSNVFGALDANHFQIFVTGSAFTVRNIPEEYYNKDEDYFFVRNWDGFCCFILKNAKTNALNGHTLVSDGNYKFRLYDKYDDGSGYVFNQYSSIVRLTYDWGNDKWNYSDTNEYLCLDPFKVVYCPIDIPFKNKDGNHFTRIGFVGDRPYFANTDEQLQGLTVGELSIVPYDVPQSLLCLSMFDVTSNDTTEHLFTEWIHNIENVDSYVSRLDLEDPFSTLAYNIPWCVFPEFEFIEGHKYKLSLTYGTGVDPVIRTFTVAKTIKNTDIVPTPTPTPEPTSTPDPNQGLIDSNKETQNILNDQTNAIKENTETNKNIFQKIGDIFNLLNPLSENFFVYKLLELLFEGLKSFILPSSDFISNYFNELSSWFQERLGFLWTPFDIVNTFLEKLNNNSLFVEPIIHIPNIVEPFTGQQLISATDYNLNSLLEKENFNTMYNVYLVIVDFIIYLGVLTLCYNTLVGVFRGSPDSITVVPSDDTKSYNRAVFNEKVSQYRKNIRKDKGGS